MSKVYAKILVSEITQEILDKSLISNPFKARRTQDGKYILLTFTEDNLPLELFKLNYSLLNSTEVLTELQNAEWDSNGSIPAIIRSSTQPQTVILEYERSMGGDFVSNVLDVSRNSSGYVSASWTGIDGTNSTMILEGSNDNQNWSELGGDLGGIVIQSLQDDSQIWEFTLFTTKYIRLSYKANNVTTGIVTIEGYKK